ncbi:YkgJ family cysteine cluster protein [Rhodopseudomonas boonkerdii]|uniref:YkgJ family cysteine cluster protein n=1 Tax=Rhodopseudomonas boonkerdii TaxID=475937 RepID=UPI001E659DDF|nr:YkgJ family cysteine cluster protein [Rhodopseudomonas boonkerdii]UGV27223.1 YkgJ family cysteine cluster protein [Rhodopseudomonas boonkerdii]
MSAQDAIDFVSDDIAEVGALMRSLSGRYEAIFGNFRSACGVVCERAASLQDAARDVVDLAGAASASVYAHIPNQPPLACASGCAACCHLYVQIPPGIARLMADHVETHFSPAERDALYGRLQIAAAAVRNAADPTKLRHRCPLLGEDNCCTVYDVRPLSCRAFTSRSVARCNDVVFGDIADGTGVEQNAAHYRIHMEATFALEQAARDRGLPADQQGLAEALLAEMGAR